MQKGGKKDVASDYLVECKSAGPAIRLKESIIIPSDLQKKKNALVQKVQSIRREVR